MIVVVRWVSMKSNKRPLDDVDKRRLKIQLVTDQLRKMKGVTERYEGSTVP